MLLIQYHDAPTTAEWASDGPTRNAVRNAQHRADAHNRPQYIHASNDSIRIVMPAPHRNVTVPATAVSFIGRIT